MTLAAITTAIREGSPDGLARAMVGVDVSCPPPQRPTHPVWAWLDCLKHAPPDYPWETMLATWVKGGGPSNPVLEPVERVWNKANGDARVLLASGRNDAHRRQPPVASLLRRAVSLDAVHAVRALLASGASPLEPAGLWPSTSGNHDDGEAWYALRGNPDMAEVLAAASGPLPATRATASWLLARSSMWTPEHPAWAKLPSILDPEWQASIVSEWESSQGSGACAWWLARPADMKVMVPVLTAAGHNPWLSLLPSLNSERVSPDDVLAWPAITDLTYPPLPSSPRQLRKAVSLPALQWLRHTGSHGRRTESSNEDDTTARAVALQHLEKLQPAWTAAGEGPFTEGELAEFFRESQILNDATVWRLHPEWMAPHARTGRTPLWHATDIDSAHRWFYRGCRLDAVDAEGNQVFTLLVARSMLAGRHGSELGTWALERLRLGESPASGYAWGRSLDEWVQGRNDLTAALARRRKEEGLSPGEIQEKPDALFVRAARLDTPAVSRLLNEGASPNRADAAGQTPLAAAISATARTKKELGAQRDVVDMLFSAGASYIQPDGRALIEILFGQKSLHRIHTVGQELLFIALREHEKAKAPWPPSLIACALERVRSSDAWDSMGPWAMVHWRSHLLEPGWDDGSGKEPDLVERASHLLEHAFVHLNHDGALDHPAAWKPWVDVLHSNACPQVNAVWSDWRKKDDNDARWRAIEEAVRLDITLASPASAQGPRPRL